MDNDGFTMVALSDPLTLQECFEPKSPPPLRAPIYLGARLRLSRSLDEYILAQIWRPYPVARLYLINLTDGRAWAEGAAIPTGCRGPYTREVIVACLGHSCLSDWTVLSTRSPDDC